MYIKRIAGLLLSLMIALTFIPSMAFADTENPAGDPASDGADAVELQEEDVELVSDGTDDVSDEQVPAAAQNEDAAPEEAAIAFEQDSLSLDMTELCNYKDCDNYDSYVYYTLNLKSGAATRFDSSDTGVAYIEDWGDAYAKVRLRKSGIAVITAYDEAGNTAECELNISASMRDFVIYYYGEISVGDTVEPYIRTYPDFASTPELEWTSSDENVAVVDNTGKVTAKKYGPVTITATFGDISDTYDLRWKSEDDNQSSDLFNFRIIGGAEATITGYKGTDTVVNIPEEISGYPVTGIDSISSQNDVKITNVTLPDTLKKIGYEAFYNKDYLKEIVIPASVTSIGDGAFSGCDRLQKVVINSDADISNRMFYECPYLSSVTFNGKTKKIGNSAFEDCDKLESIVLPEGLESIGDDAFYYGGLRNITLPQSLRTIGEHVFNSDNVQQLKIPANVEKIGNTGGVASFSVDSANPNYSAKNGVLFSKDGKTLIQHPGESVAFHYTVPVGTVVIGKEAFYFSRNIIQFDCPETVTTIEANAFTNWNSIQIVLPKSLRVIGSSNFNDEYNKIFYRGSKTDWANIDIDIYENDSLKNQSAIVYGYTRTGLKLSRSSVNCTLAQRPTVTLTYNDGKPVPRDNIDIYSYSEYGQRSAYVGRSSENNNIYIDPEKIGKSTVCIVADGLATELTVNVTGRTPISEVPFRAIDDETYTGKAIQTGAYTADNKLYNLYSSDYTVTYKNNKNVGTATVIITGKNRCTGTVTKTFKILPRQTTYLKKATSGKKKITLKWKRQKNITGYQIQYSRKSSFKGAKTVTIKNNKTVKKTIKKLKSKKWYFFRIRVYKTVGGKKYYSDWNSSGYTQVRIK